MWRILEWNRKKDVDLYKQILIAEIERIRVRCEN